VFVTLYFIEVKDSLCTGSCDIVNVLQFLIVFIFSTQHILSLNLLVVCYKN